MRKILLSIFLLSFSISVNAQLFGTHWDEGYYYNYEGQKVSGFVAEYIDTDDFIFKKDEKADKEKIRVSDIKSLVIKSDSSAIDSFTLSKDKDFFNKLLLVVYDINSLKLYAKLKLKHTGAFQYGTGLTMGLPAGNSVKESYYYGDNPDNLTKLNNKNFIAAMSEIMADNPTIVKLIKKKRLTFYRIVEIMKFAKTRDSQ